MIHPLTKMLVPIIGGRAAIQNQHADSSVFNLIFALSDGPVASIEAQEQAGRFWWKHGTRITKRYTRALIRAGA